MSEPAIRHAMDAIFEPGMVLSSTALDVVVQISSGAISAALACPPGFEPRPGDRLLIASNGDRAYAIAVLSALRPASAPSLRAADGASAMLEDGAIAVRDRDGRLLFEHKDGMSTISSADHTLRFQASKIELHASEEATISAPQLNLRASKDLEIDAGRAAIRSESMEASGERAKLAFGETLAVGARLTTAYERVSHVADVIEVEAERVIERAREVYRETEGLMQITAGRIRQIAKDSLHLAGLRTSLRAEADVSIKGERIELG